MTTRFEAAGIDSRSPDFHRCHDPVVIEEILWRDSFGVPMPYFPRSVLRTAARELLAVSPDVYFVIAETQGQYCGFALGQTVGPTMWRKFAAAHLARHPFAILWMVVRLKLLLPLQWRANRWLSRRRLVATDGIPATVPGIPKLDHPFAWTTSGETNRAEIGQVDELFVCDTCRGKGIGPGLLTYLAWEMARGKVTLIEAHVDAGNLASLRAFQKAGWEAFLTAGGDYYVCHRPPPAVVGDCGDYDVVRRPEQVNHSNVN